MQPPLKSDSALERYRTGYLKLKSVLYDRATELPAFPVLFDALRSALDQRKLLGLLHFEIVNLDLVESLYGWQVFDQVLGHASSVLHEAVGKQLPAGTLLAINSVAGDRFVAFVVEGPDGTDLDATYLDGLGSAVCEKLALAFQDPSFAGLAPELLFRSGHSRISLDPFFRFERRVYSAMREASRFNDERERRRERSWSEELRRIIRTSAIDAVFQPVVDLHSHEVLGHEAFVRGPRDSLFERPEAMFSLSDRVGVADELDLLCRKTALQASARVAGIGKLFLNVYTGAGKRGNDPGADVEELIRGSAIDPKNVVFEISERRAGDDPAALVAMLDRFRAGGCGVAIDDVGTGRGSRAIVDAARPDFIKLDVSLVRGIDTSPIKQEMAFSLIEMAQGVGADVIAEGVEREAQAAALIAAGGKFGQGYLFARPGPSGGLAEPPAADAGNVR